MTSTTTSTGGREPADPRAERSRRVIREAALAELAAAGLGGFTIESVAARAGVGKATVYRHWDGKLALVADALETLNEQPAPQAGAGSARERVVQLVRHFHHGYAARRRRALIDALAAGTASGELPDDLDPDLASIALVGAVLYRRLLTPAPFDPSRVPELVELVLGPATPGPSAS